LVLDICFLNFSPFDQKTQTQKLSNDKVMKTHIMSIFALAALLLLTSSVSAYADSMLSLGRPTTPLGSANYRSNAPSGLVDAPLEVLSIFSTGGPSTVLKVKLAIPPGSIRPTQIYMGRQTQTGMIDIGRMPLDSDRTVEFTMPGVQGAISEGSSKTYSIRASFDSGSFGTGTVSGDFCRIQVVSVQYTTALGNQVVYTSPVPFFGPEHRWFPATAKWTLTGTPSITKVMDGDVLSKMTATFQLRVAVSGNDIVIPQTGDVTVLGCVGRESLICPLSGLTVIPSVTRISDGSTANMTLTADLPPEEGDFDRSGIVTFKIAQINWAVEGGANPFKVEQTWGLESFRTTTVETLTASAHPPVSSRLPDVSHQTFEEITSILSPDAAGFPGQLVSETGVLIFTSTQPNGLHRVVFPQTTPNLAQIMQVDMDMTSDDMVPHILAPADLSVDSRVTLVEYPVLNLVRDQAGDKVIALRFEVLLGGQRMYGIAKRTGDRSCHVNFYWGNGSAHGIPGASLDMLDLSASLPPVVPATGTARPQRFKFGNLEYLRKDVTGFSMTADLLPFATVVEVSSDLSTWHAVVPVLSQLQPSRVDVGYLVDVRVDHDKLPLALQSAPAVYFRLNHAH
jgi:hypothetical protein